MTAALDRLDLRPRTSGGRITARCPAHDDSTPSLSVSNGDGKVLLNCHAGCDPADVVAALGLRMPDLFDTPAERRDRPITVAEYRYTDEAGALLFVVERRVPKGFVQRAASGAYSTRGIRKPLYRLPEVVAAVADGRTVWIVEGEKDADRLAALGEVATCNPMGAGKWRDEHAVSLVGAARVVVVADRDEEGRKHAAAVAASLAGAVIAVEVLEPVAGKDVSDHLDAGHGLDALSTAGPVPAVDDRTPAVGGFRARLLSRDQLGELPQPAPLIEDTLDLRTVVVLSGRRGRAKSLLALDWACCLSTGKPWQGRPVETGPALWVAGEGAYGMGRRVDAWEYAWQRTVPGDRLVTFPAPVNLFTGKHVDELVDVVREDRYRLVVFDTWARCTVGGRENDNSDATLVFDRLEALRHLGATSLLVAHTDAEDTKTRGATALEDNADTVYRIKGDAVHLVLSRTKRKDGPEHDEMHLRLREVLDSVVLEATGAADMIDSADKLMSAYLSAFDGRRASKAELRAVAGMPSASFHRGLSALVRDGFLVEHSPGSRAYYTRGAK